MFVEQQAVHHSPPHMVKPKDEAMNKMVEAAGGAMLIVLFACISFLAILGTFWVVVQVNV